MSAVTVDANSGRFLIVPAQNTHTVDGPKKKKCLCGGGGGGGLTR